MKDGMRIEWERMIWKGMNGKNDERMNENGSRVVREDGMRERRKWIEE